MVEAVGAEFADYAVEPSGDEGEFTTHHIALVNDQFIRRKHASHIQHVHLNQYYHLELSFMSARTNFEGPGCSRHCAGFEKKQEGSLASSKHRRTGKRRAGRGQGGHREDEANSL